MATTFTSAPALIAPGQKASLVFTLGGAGANYVRVSCTVAPDGSALDKILKDTGASSPRTQLYQGDAGAANPLVYTFDKGGTYTLVAQEYTKGATPGFGGAYEGDPRGAPEETEVGSPTTLTVYVGERVTMPIGVSPDTAELTLFVWNATICATTLASHGQVTPAIVNPATPRAKTAILDSSVVSALAALADVAASTAIGDVSDFVSNYITKFNAHIIRTTGSTHANADNDNGIPTALSAPPTPQSLTNFVTLALKALRQHEANDSGTGFGSATSDYHSTADMTNQPLVRGVSGPVDAYGALGELFRCYEAHRALGTPVHGTADTTNTLATEAKLLAVYTAFNARLAASAPSPVSGENTASALFRAIGAKVS